MASGVERDIHGNDLLALQESERRFRAISACTYDWESWHAPDCRVQWINKAVARMTGYSVDECLAMDDYPLPLVDESDRPRIRQILSQAVAGLPGNDVEFRFRTREGRECWGAISWQSIADDYGVNMGFRTSVRDIADRKDMEQKIRNYAENLEQLVQDRTARLMELETRRAQVDRLAALGQLAAGVAHEINNPLAGIRNAVELIRDSLPANYEDRVLLEMVQSEIDRISGIVRQLYQLHRPQPATDTNVDLVHCVQQTVELMSGISRRHQVAIHVRSGKNAPVCASLPEGELKQVLYNILLNGIQASKEGSVVDVLVEERESTSVIQVLDYGVGVSEEILPRIFDPFFTTKHGTSHPGMGLGLSVSQSLIQAMGGQIEVDSIPGKQTLFQITLPRRQHKDLGSTSASAANGDGDRSIQQERG